MSRFDIVHKAATVTRIQAMGAQRGVSLIELMVALVIASLLAIGIVQIFDSTRAAFNTNSALARAQEGSRYALDYIQKDLRLVGHMGTRNEQSAQPGSSAGALPNHLYNHLAPEAGNGRPETAPWIYRLDVPIQAFEYNGTGIGATYSMTADPELSAAATEWTPALPVELTSLVGSAMRGSDILVIRYLSAEFVTTINTAERPDGMPVVADIPFSPDTGRIVWNNDPAYAPGLSNFIRQGGVYAFSNASAISLFQINRAAGNVAFAVGGDGMNSRGWVNPGPPAVPSNALGVAENTSDYGRLLPIHRFNFAVYYVALGADGQPALFRVGLKDAPTAPDAAGSLGAPEELVAGVDALQTVFGVVNCSPAAAGCVRDSDQPRGYLTAAGVNAGSWQTNADTACGTAGACVRWGDVVNARVALLTRSNQGSAAQLESQVSRNVAGATFTPNASDRRFRQVYETHVSLRNRNRG
jgi:type IV pilus assembly protein PilW